MYYILVSFDENGEQETEYELCVFYEKITVLKKNTTLVFTHEDFIREAKRDKEVYVVGDKETFEHVLPHPMLKHVYLNKTGFEGPPYRLLVALFGEPEEYKDMYVFSNFPTHEEFQYLDIMKRILAAPLRNTRNAPTRSVFGEHMTFDLSESFPLLTTKRMPLRVIFEELMFFIRGQTDTKILEEKKVNIWKGNTSREFIKSLGLDLPEGEMGYMYGKVWRAFGSPGGASVDQLSNVIRLIKENPYSRRIMMTTYDPAHADKGVLYPCHGIVVQFYVDKGRLSCHMYQRSADWFLGVPFNIASYALLTHMIAAVTSLGVGKLVMSFGDCHIYEDHEDQCREQLSRMNNMSHFPTLEIAEKNIDDYEFSDLKLNHYTPCPPIRATMIA